MSEITLYSKDSIQITNLRIQINEIMYAVKNITSVRIDKSSPSRLIWYLLLIIGIFAFAVHLAGAIILTAIGLLGIFTSKPTYHLVLVTSAAQAQTLSSKKQSDLIPVLQAIQTSIISN
jgi:hypothetical protein